MGADLLAMWAAWPKELNGEYADLTALVTRRIDALRVEALIGRDDLYPAMSEDALPTEDDSEEEQAEKLTELKRTLKQALVDLEADTRNVIIGEVRGQRFLLTGGMSWGDSPSDAYDALTALVLLDLLDDVTEEEN